VNPRDLYRLLSRNREVTVRHHTYAATRAIVPENEWQDFGTDDAPFFGTWEHYGGGYDTAAFRRDGSRFVHLRGVIRADPATDGRLCILPPGFRPEYVTPLAAIDSVMTTGEVRALYVRPSGIVQISPFNVGTTVEFLSIGNHRFRAAV
jgi:hypothetical protein